VESSPPLSLQSLVRLAGSAAALAEIEPGLAVTRGLTDTAGPLATEDAGEALPLQREGFADLTGIATPAVCAVLVRAIEALRARELPPTFVYAFDETWAIGQTVNARISALVGHDYHLVEDVWAWHIAPGSGRGWPAHRGVSHVRLDRDAPEVINAWVALTEVTTDRACMHAIPLDDDPGYPDALGGLDAPLESVRAMPAAAGDALFWNANVLHWGGRCAAHAIGPRVSCSFTLCRADAASRFPDLRRLVPEELDLAARMNAVARMVLLYGAADREDVRGVVREWASLTHALASRFT
jgi:Phytanoyl-CoA dioxygenase (PhyH)